MSYVGRLLIEGPFYGVPVRKLNMQPCSEHIIFYPIITGFFIIDLSYGHKALQQNAAPL